MRIVIGMDDTVKMLAAKFPDCPRVLLVSTMLSDAHRELYEKHASLVAKIQDEQRSAVAPVQTGGAA